MTEEKKKPGRPAHVPTDETREVVKALASFGVTQVEIGKYIGVNDDTLRKYYQKELDTAMVEKNMKVAGFLYGVASGEDLANGATYADATRAAMFWLKTRAQWHEKAEVDLKSSDGSMSPKDATANAVLDALKAKHADPE